MKKKTKSDTRPSTTFRLTDSQIEEYRHCASEEGFESLQQWMIHLANERSKRVREALESETFIRVGGRLILPGDIDANDFEKFASAVKKLKG